MKHNVVDECLKAFLPHGARIDETYWWSYPRLEEYSISLPLLQGKVHSKLEVEGIVLVSMSLILNVVDFLLFFGSWF